MPAVSAVGVPVAQGAAVPEVLITAESQSPAPRPDGVQVHIANVDAEATAIQAATRTWSFIGTLRIVINTRVRPHPHLITRPLQLSVYLQQVIAREGRLDKMCVPRVC